MNYRIENEKIRAEISSRGAQLCSLQAAGGMEYLWQGDEKIWEDHAPILFPYVGRMYEKKYTCRGREYSMDIHGFAPTREFECRRIRKDYLLCRLEDSKETRGMYPFAFCFEVHYELLENKILIYFIVQNKEEKKMYFGLGGHPGFRVPLREQERFEDYFLQFPKGTEPEKVGISSAGFLTGDLWEQSAGAKGAADGAKGRSFGKKKLELNCDNRLQLHHSLFDQDAVVLQNMGSMVQLWGPKGAVLQVRYPKMPYLGLWHWPKTEASYVCIEPWSSLPSREGVTEALEEKPDLICLEGYGEYVNQWEIELMEGKTAETPGLL